MQIADLEVAGAIGAGCVVPIGICALVIWLNIKQQANDKMMVRAELERAYGPDVAIQSIRAGKSDVSLIETHGIGGRCYRAIVIAGAGPVTTLWKIERGRCSRAER